MTGFVTLAVGDEKYYRLAANLLLSYRRNGNCEAPFVVFADRENSYTDLFDRVIIVDNPTYSYLDKLNMLLHPPFEHNIFIDADCLIYNDVQDLLEDAQINGVRCYGRALQLDSTEGCFLLEDSGKYRDIINFIPQMHGGIIFFGSDSLTKRIYNEACQIADEYDSYKFKYFSHPADEPILALATAANNCPPIEIRANREIHPFVFLPTVEKIRVNSRLRRLKFLTTHDQANWCDAIILHWQNINTEKPLYSREVDRFHYREVTVKAKYIQHFFRYHISHLFNRIKRYISRKLR